MEINVLENFSAAELEELYLNINYIIDIRVLTLNVIIYKNYV